MSFSLVAALLLHALAQQSAGANGADVSGVETAGAAIQAAPPTLGAHTLLGQEDQVGANPAVTFPIATQVGGSSFLAFSAGYASNSNPPTDNLANLWTLLGSPVVYNGYNGVFDVKAYLSLSGNGGSGHLVSIVKNGVPSGELTLPFVEIRNADVLHAVAQNYPSGAQVVSGSVATTGPALLLAFWFGDGGGLSHSAVPNNGFTVIESFVNLPPLSAVQCVVAFKQVSGAGSYNVTWTHSPDPGAPLWLFAFQSGETIFASGFE